MATSVHISSSNDPEAHLAETDDLLAAGLDIGVPRKAPPKADLSSLEPPATTTGSGTPYPLTISRVDELPAANTKSDKIAFVNLPPAAVHSNSNVIIKFDDVPLQESLEDYASRDPYPIPSAKDREGYFVDRHYDWWLSGLKDYLSIKQMLAKNGADFPTNPTFMDFGCASGRVLRHFACQEPASCLWGCDINLRHVEWVRKYLHRHIKIFQNSLIPHLPIEDNSLDLVYAFSVFTHIDDLELMWIAEIRRILKKGGFAYLTVHSEDTWKELTPRDPLYPLLLSCKDHTEGYSVMAESYFKPMPFPRMVFHWTRSSVYNAIVFHSSGYVRDTWGRLLTVRDRWTRGHLRQDVVLLQK
jgi:SAM-dependent methyltransferase